MNGTSELKGKYDCNFDGVTKLPFKKDVLLKKKKKKDVLFYILTYDV